MWSGVGDATAPVITVEFAAHAGAILALCPLPWSPNLIASGGTDRVVKLWDVATAGVAPYSPVLILGSAQNTDPNAGERKVKGPEKEMGVQCERAAHVDTGGVVGTVTPSLSPAMARIVLTLPLCCQSFPGYEPQHVYPAARIASG